MNKKYLNFTLILTVLSVFDIITTQYALTKYPQLSEGNPIIALFTSSLLSFLLIKAFGIMAIAGIYHKIKNRNKTLATIGQCTIIIMMLFVVSNNIFQIIGVGSAESGSIIISNDSILSYSAPSLDHSPSPATYNWADIYIDTANYNTIHNFRFVPYYKAFVNSFESTTFTFTSGATGSGGVFWYDANATSIYYVFNSDMVITGNHIVLSFASPIYQNITNCPVNCAGSTLSGTPNSAHPVIIKTAQFPTESIPGTYEDVQISLSATDTYNIQYPIPGYFNVSIIKNSYINSKYFIDSYSGSSHYSQETSFNKVNISGATFVYDQGISLNATLSGGLYVVTLINSTLGVPISTSGNITFNSSTYDLNTVANISLNISNPDYSSFTYGIQLLDPYNNIIETGMLPYNSSFPYLTTTDTTFNEGGVWEIQLFSCGSGLCNANKYVMATDTAIVFGGAFNSTLSYSNLTLKSRYDSYYNNSKFIIDFGIAYTALWNQTTQYSHRIDLIDVNNVAISSYIPIRICDEPSAIELLFPSTLFNCVAVDTNFDISDFIDDPFVDLTSSEKASTISFSPTTAWTNGTYQVKLYEVNALSGTPSLLLTDSFIVINQSGIGIIPGTGTGTGQLPNEELLTGTNPEAIAVIDQFVYLLGMGLNTVSKMLFTLIVAVVLGIIALWLSKDGNIAALVMFAPFAFFTYIEYIPKWIFVIVIIMLAIISRVFR